MSRTSGGEHGRSEGTSFRGNDDDISFPCNSLSAVDILLFHPMKETGTLFVFENLPEKEAV
jgi:hypothetical protein